MKVYLALDLPGVDDDKEVADLVNRTVMADQSVEDGILYRNFTELLRDWINLKGDVFAQWGVPF